MSATPSTARLVVLPPGAEVVAAIAELSGEEAWVQGTGHVEEVTLRVAAEGSDAVTALRGRFNVLTLSGPRGGPLTVTLARQSDAGLQVLGGELVRARSAGVTVTLVPATRDTALSKGGAAAWTRAAAASDARAQDAEDEHDEPTPEVGDRVEHFAFGVCEVLTAEGDRLRIRDLEGARRVREVALSMLRVSGPTESDGKRLFQLTRRSAMT